MPSDEEQIVVYVREVIPEQDALIKELVEAIRNPSDEVLEAMAAVDDELGNLNGVGHEPAYAYRLMLKAAIDKILEDSANATIE